MDIGEAARIVRRIVRGSPIITLDYPIRAEPRYGYGKPPHPQLCAMVERWTDSYRALIAEMRHLEHLFARIPADDQGGAFWQNRYFTGADAAALYALLASRRPRRLIEIGSGNSTKFARQAVTDNATGTTIICIDPEPRAELAQSADMIVRRSLQSTDLSVFDQVEPGDFVSLDGSHYCYQSSDTAVFFLEVLPYLPTGTLVQVHDIRIPYDYPRKIRRLWYGEQYVLAAWLLGRGEVEIVWPSLYVWTTPELRAQMPALVTTGGSSFWFRM